jgi:hypothetical protein
MHQTGHISVGTKLAGEHGLLVSPLDSNRLLMNNMSKRFAMTEVLENKNQQKTVFWSLTHSAIRVPDGISPPTASRTEENMHTSQCLKKGACRGSEWNP